VVDIGQRDEFVLHTRRLQLLGHFQRLLVRHRRVLCPNNQQHRRIVAVNIGSWTRRCDLFRLAVVGKAAPVIDA
jgi:hypothetical protein